MHTESLESILVRIFHLYYGVHSNIWTIPCTYQNTTKSKTWHGWYKHFVTTEDTQAHTLISTLRKLKKKERKIQLNIVTSQFSVRRDLWNSHENVFFTIFTIFLLVSISHSCHNIKVTDFAVIYTLKIALKASPYKCMKP